MEKSDIVTLFDYNYWATARVLEATNRITAEQYAAPAGLSHGSLRATLVHTLAAETVWRLRCQGSSPTSLLAEAEFPTLEVLRARWQAEEQAMRAYLAGINAADLHGTVRYHSTKGIPYDQTLWQILAHVVNHGTQSRAEAGIALLAFGQSPGDLDMILYFRNLQR
jgi:uncharacterized damage-inducible protein DinB